MLSFVPTGIPWPRVCGLAPPSADAIRDPYTRGKGGGREEREVVGSKGWREKASESKTTFL